MWSQQFRKNEYTRTPSLRPVFFPLTLVEDWGWYYPFTGTPCYLLLQKGADQLSIVYWSRWCVNTRSFMIPIFSEIPFLFHSRFKLNCKCCKTHRDNSFFSQSIAIRTNSSQVNKTRGLKQVSEENQCSPKPYTLQKKLRLLVSGDGNCINHTRFVQTGILAVGTHDKHLFPCSPLFSPRKEWQDCTKQALIAKYLDNLERDYGTETKADIRFNMLCITKKRNMYSIAQHSSDHFKLRPPFRPAEALWAAVWKTLH